MGQISKKKQARLNLYNSDPLKYDRAFVRVTGALTALIEDIELANEVMPEIYPDALLISANASLNSFYPGKEINDPSIVEKLGQIAETQMKVSKMFEMVINKIV